MTAHTGMKPRFSRIAAHVGSFQVFTGGPMSTAYFRDINPDVEVVSTSSVVKDLKFDCCDDPFKVIEYTLTIRRKPTVL